MKADRSHPLAADAAPESRDNGTVDLVVLNSGVVRTREAFVVPRGSKEQVDIPALFALIRHPKAGVGMFDTGYSTRFYDATRRFPYRLYRYLTPVRMTRDQDAVEQLQRLGVRASDVRWIVLSHFDPDHIGGLRDFPEARVTCMRSAWSETVGRTGFEALQRRILPGLLPRDLPDRLELIDAIDEPWDGPFHASHDLFGDGSVRLVDLPGHAPGHVGAVIRTNDDRRVLLAADACWSRAALRRGGAVVHRALAHDRGKQDATYELLWRVSRALPDLEVIPAHCPEAASAWLPGGAWRFS